MHHAPTKAARRRPSARAGQGEKTIFLPLNESDRPRIKLKLCMYVPSYVPGLGRVHRSFTFYCAHLQQQLQPAPTTPTTLHCDHHNKTEPLQQINQTI